MISSALFLYKDIQWGEEAQIGFNAGDGFSSFSLPGALTEVTTDIDEQSNVYHPGVFIYRIDSELSLLTNLLKQLYIYSTKCVLWSSCTELT